MPTIEFHGFPEAELDDRTAEVKERVAGLEFADAIVLHRGPESSVVDLEGRRRPFLRLLTRSPERARLLRARLGTLADIETVFIEFHERSVR